MPKAVRILGDNLVYTKNTILDVLVEEGRDDGASIRVATLAGLGLSMSSKWSIHKGLSDGTLVRVLPEYQVEDGSAIWLVYPKSNVLTA